MQGINFIWGVAKSTSWQGPLGKALATGGVKSVSRDSEVVRHQHYRYGYTKHSRWVVRVVFSLPSGVVVSIRLGVVELGVKIY